MQWTFSYRTIPQQYNRRYINLPLLLLYNLGQKVDIATDKGNMMEILDR